jgi:hypothetical protein
MAAIACVTTSYAEKSRAVRPAWMAAMLSEGMDAEERVVEERVVEERVILRQLPASSACQERRG